MIGQPEFSRALDFVMLVGAARCDSDSGQFAALQALLPKLGDLIRAGDYDGATSEVHRIMGPEWKPGKEWIIPS